MTEGIRCAECDTPLPSHWPKGLCSRCALEGALQVQGGEDQAGASQIGNKAGAENGRQPAEECSSTRIGGYQLLERIGEGGFGVVWMAEQEEPVRRQVALKIIKLGMDTRQVIARFEAERQALAVMDHPHIAKVLDAGATHTGRPYFVMELVRGIKITDYCDQNHLPTADRLDLFIKVCWAIQHAHLKGIIHRDIKPSNVLVSLHDGVPIPKVIDFGIAKATEGRLTDKTLFTSIQQFIGTPAYVSPEQAEMGGLDIDTRSDIYSLGVLLYELLTGQTPFDTKELVHSGLDAIRRTLREVEPPCPSTRLSTLDRGTLTATARQRQTEPPKLLYQIRGDLDCIVMKCLEKDRTRRYETANALATDIQRHLNNEPVVASPPAKFYRFGKLVQRNKVLFAAAAAVTIALLAGVGVSSTLYFAERAARRRAVAAEQAQRLLLQRTELAERSAQAEASQLGDILSKLGQLSQAEKHLRDSLALQQKLAGEDNLQTAVSLHNLGRVLSREGKLTDAETVLRRAIGLRQKFLGNQDVGTVEPLFLLSGALQRQGRLVDAEKVLEDALRRLQSYAETKQSGEIPALGVVLHHLADLLRQCKDLQGARSYAEQALAMYDRHPDWPAEERQHAIEIRNAINAAVEGIPISQTATNSKPASWRGSPETTQTLSTPSLLARGGLFAAEGHWSEAVADIAQGIEGEPTAFSYLTLAVLLLANDDLEGYRQLCQKILSRFATTTQPFEAERAAKACLLLSSSGADYDAVGKMVETAITKGKENRFYAYVQCTKGLFEYRQGRFQSAIDWIHKGVGFDEPAEGQALDPFGRVTSYAVLAMAHSKLKQTTNSSAAIDKARTLANQMPTVGSRISINWHEWIIAHVILDEAEALLRNPPDKEQKNNP